MAVTRLLLSSLLPWRWSSFYCIDDVVMGGISSSSVNLNNSGNLVFEGSVRVENNGGFASCKSDLLGVEKSVLNGGNTLVIRTRGDGKTYRIRASIDGNVDGVYYNCYIKTDRDNETVTSCPIASMNPTWRGADLSGRVPQMRDAAQIQSLGFMITKEGGQTGHFRLEVLSVAVEAR